MYKGRLEAFSDGVLAIIITIMVLELKVPQSPDLSALLELTPVFLSYLLSFMYLGIYWNNHHHLFQVVTHIDGKVLWANMHLLFWLSLLPFVTAWAGENHFAAAPVAAYGLVLFMAGMAYFILSKALLAVHSKESDLANALGKDTKGKISIILNLVGIILTFVSPWLSILMYVMVAAIWLVPDQRIEKIKK